MKTITINDQYKIEFDGLQFTPYWFKAGGEEITFGIAKGQETKDKWVSSGKYFNKLELACKWVVDDAMSKDGEISMGEFIAEYREVWEDIKRSVGL